MEKKDGKKNATAFSNLRQIKNKMTTQFLCISLTDQKLHIKLNEII